MTDVTIAAAAEHLASIMSGHVDANEVGARIRRALKRLTGEAWSVRTFSMFTAIRHRVVGQRITADEAAMLRDLLGVEVTIDEAAIYAEVRYDQRAAAMRHVEARAAAR